MDSFTLFNKNNVEYINNILDTNINKLRKNEIFSNLEQNLLKNASDFEKNLSEEQQVIFEEIVSSLFELENYKHVFCYFYGIKTGEDISKL